jgi:hypothetical protein
MLSNMLGMQGNDKLCMACSTKFVAQIIARKSKFWLVPVEANSTAKDSKNSAGHTNQEDGARGALKTNMTDWSRWVLPVLRPIPAVVAGVRG